MKSFNEFLSENNKAEQKFFNEKKCPKCKKPLQFGYRGWTNVKRCPEGHYEKSGPPLRED